MPLRVARDGYVPCHFCEGNTFTRHLQYLQDHPMTQRPSQSLAPVRRGKPAVLRANVAPEASPADHDSQSAASLMAAVAAGEPSARETFVRQVCGSVRRIVRSLCRGTADWEDVTQQVLL